MNRPPGTRRVAILAGIVLFGLLVACSDDKDDGETLPPPSSSTTSTTAQVDLTQVSLPALAPGQPTTTTRPPGPRKASIAGKVVDANGAPVPEAFVRATYYADPAKPEVIEVITGPDGGYRIDQLFGGRWRIRAWLAPVMATLEPVSFFLGATEEKVTNLKVKAVADVAITSKMAPDPPLVGWPAELAVRVVTQTVDSEGAVERHAAPNVPVSLTNSSSWSITSGTNPAATNSDGTIRWELSCGTEGRQTLSAVVFGREFPLTLPSCLSPASTSTTTTAPPDGSTSTTKPKPKPKPTTTTTRPRTTESTQPGVRPQ